MNRSIITRCCVAAGVIATLAGCSAASQKDTAVQKQIDSQKAAQRALIDDRTAELKRNADLQKQQAFDMLESKKEALTSELKTLNDEKMQVARDTELAKKNLDIQNKACKDKVDQNVRDLEQKLSQTAKGNFQ